MKEWNLEPDTGGSDIYLGMQQLEYRIKCLLLSNRN